MVINIAKLIRLVMKIIEFAKILVENPIILKYFTSLRLNKQITIPEIVVVEIVAVKKALFAFIVVISEFDKR